MKKSLLSKTALILIILTFNISFTTVMAIENNSFISRRNIAVSRTYNNITLGKLGKITCEGQTEVNDGYSAGLIMELQKKNDSWTTVNSWSGTNVDCIILNKSWYAEKGTYRLKLTHEAYDSGMNKVESIIKYSETIFY